MLRVYGIHSVQSLRLAAALLVLGHAAFAQTTGAVEGIVSDATQAVVPGATVKLTNQGTGVVVTTATNPTGYFLFETLPVGVYDISVNQPGFKVFSLKDVKLDVASRVRQDIALAVGQPSVTVEANPVQVDTANGTVGAVITQEQIETAGLNGRHYARLAMLMPGAVYHSGSDELSSAGLNGPDSPVSINGLNNKSEG